MATFKKPKGFHPATRAAATPSKKGIDASDLGFSGLFSSLSHRE